VSAASSALRSVSIAAVGGIAAEAVIGTTGVEQAARQRRPKCDVVLAGRDTLTEQHTDGIFDHGELGQFVTEMAN
jgi:hypothetical protein